MAKLKAPLLSLGASGAIGKAIVMFPWKGINAAREYVVPANPRSDAQQTQRGHLGDAVDEWHAALYNDADRIAWNRLAGTLEDIMSGFNAFMREYIQAAILGNVWTRMYQGVISNITATSFRMEIQKAAGVPLPRIRVGVSKTFFPFEDVFADMGGGLWRVNVINLPEDTLHYCWVYVGALAANNYSRLGIYQVKTLAA